MLSTLLGRADHEVITASGVTDALQLLENVRVNVLLSDLGLPDGDGLDLVTKAKRIQPKLKAIALTARESLADYRLGQKAGFDPEHGIDKHFYDEAGSRLFGPRPLVGALRSVGRFQRERDPVARARLRRASRLDRCHRGSEL